MVRQKQIVSLQLIGPLHSLTKAKCEEIQNLLLKWYYLKQRILPWRSIASSKKDLSRRAYAVWVSEIMLQQTQVATVIKYFNEWLSKWPTVDALAKASLEDVNGVWAGLGYYSRAKRLHEGAIKITEEFGGEFPQNRDSLQKQLPGVGRYTASAIASIVMGEPVGVVDGNVMRVLSRLLAIGGDISSQSVVEEIWKFADRLVTQDKPGDFNQAMMELGATVCLPKNPSCSSCPLKEHCVAYSLAENTKSKNSLATHFSKANASFSASVQDIECVPNCGLCLKKGEWVESSGVENFPRKSRKTLVKKKTSAVLVIKTASANTSVRYLLVQRPDSGLLANLWEFFSLSLHEEEGTSQPNIPPIGDCSALETIKENLSCFHLPESVHKTLNFLSDVIHIFSHIRQTYKVYEATVDTLFVIKLPEGYQGYKWMTEEEFLGSATSTAMKKVFKSYSACQKEGKKRSLKGTKEGKVKMDKKQKTMTHFFLPKTKSK